MSTNMNGGFHVVITSDRHGCPKVRWLTPAQSDRRLREQMAQRQRELDVQARRATFHRVK